MAQSAEEDIDLITPKKNNDDENPNEGVMDDNEVAALLMKLKHKMPTQSITIDNNNEKEQKQTEKADHKTNTSNDKSSNNEIKKVNNNNNTTINTTDKNEIKEVDNNNNTTNDNTNNSTTNENEIKDIKSSNNNNKIENENKTDVTEPTEQKTNKTNNINTNNSNTTSRKRTYSEMQKNNTNNTNASKVNDKLSDPRSKRPKTIIKKLKSIKLDKKEEISEKSQQLPAKEPFSDTDWNHTKFLFVRLTYFNKRKCRKLPLFISSYSSFTNFIEYYFPSLHNCKWHCECDENWIESLDDFNAIRDEHSTNNNNMFLELMIVNESLQMKNIYAPKAVYIDNPYKCTYPPAHTNDTPPQPQSQPPPQAIIPPQQQQPQPQPQPQPHPQQHIPINPHSAPAYNPYINATAAYGHGMYPTPHMNIMQQVPVQVPMQPAQIPIASAIASDPIGNVSGGYHHVTYPHYLSKSSTNHTSKLKSDRHNHNHNNKHSHSGRNSHANNSTQSRRSNISNSGAVCPDPTTYLPFAHAGQSTPQMRTLHKIVWVLQHQSKPLSIDAIRLCLPGKKKAQTNEIDYLLSSYESYNYTKSSMVSGRKVWQLCNAAFPPEFWNMQWQRTN